MVPGVSSLVRKIVFEELRLRTTKRSKNHHLCSSDRRHVIAFSIFVLTILVLMPSIFTSTSRLGSPAFAYSLNITNTDITSFGQGASTASSLKVILSPSQLPPDRNLNASVIVEAVDSFGNPVRVPHDLPVKLTISDSRFGSLTSNSVVISSGNSFTESSFVPSYIPGKTVITASTPGLSPGSSVMTTVGPTPRRLVVTLAPPTMLAALGEYTFVSVQLQDNNTQTPAPAPAPVSVVLTSNSSGVAILLNPIITIPTGSSYATETILAGGAAGVANITASAQGYVKGSALLTADVPAKVPNSVAVYFAPGTLLPDNSTYSGAVVVSLESINYSNGQVAPSIFSNSTTVYLRSSDNASMQVDTTPLVIPAGQSHAQTDIHTTFLPGKAYITAQSPGLASFTRGLTSFGLVPNAITLQFAPSVIFADGTTYNSVFVTLVDQSTNSPARAPVNTIVNLASGPSSAGSIENTIIIPAGQAYARAAYATSGTPSSVQITAAASNFTTATGNFTTMVLPITPSITLSSSSVPSDGTIQVQLHASSEGVPLNNATVTWVDDGTIGGTLDSMMTSTNSLGIATANFVGGNTLGSYTLNVVVSKLGYASFIASTTIQVTPSLLHTTFFFLPIWVLVVILAAAPVSIFVVRTIRIRRARAAEEF